MATHEPDEEARLAALRSYRVLDTDAERSFDDVVKLASQLLDAPIAAVNLIDRNRQWFKSEIGLDVREMPLDNSICRYALLERDGMVVPDTRLDPRFACNPLVTGAPGLRFYAGELLKTADGLPLGTLCVLDHRARPQGLSEKEAFALRTLARQIMTQLELRKQAHEQTMLLAQNQRTAEELRRERDRAQQMFRGMDEGFVFLDLSYIVREISPGGLRMDGRTARDIVGRSHWEAWPGTEALPLGDAIRRAMELRTPVNVEQLYVYPDGRAVWLDMRAFPAEGGLAVFYRDITERKQAERALSETAARLKFTLEAARIGDWDLDLVDDTAYRSARHDRCFGYEQPIPEWGFHTFIEHVHPDDRPAVRAAFERSISELVDWHFECRVVWPDGSVHWISAHGSLYHVDARPTRMTGIVYDISDHKGAEEALRQSEQYAREAACVAEHERQRLDAVLEAAPVAIAVTDQAGRIVRANAENRRLWGAASPRVGDVDGHGAWKGWWADDSTRSGLPLRPQDWATARALRGEDDLRQIIEIEPFDDPAHRRILLNSGAPIRDAAGVIVGAVVAQMDITDRVKAEKALRAADQRKDEFLAMLAHELRNPLAPITSAAHILSSDRLDVPRAQRLAAIIARQASHMTGLVDDLLDVSRVTRGLITLEREPVDAKAVIADAIEQVRPLIDKHEHRFSLHLSSETAVVQADRKRLVQIFANLLNNAAKYTPDGGVISIRMEVQPQALRIEVRDNGIGMSGELLDRAFELFAQAERSADRTQGGLGIGLALVRSLARLHGGDVTARSDGPHTGSTFEVTLPRMVAPEREAPRAPQEVRGPVTALRLMVVDDNEDAAATLGLYLETCGYEVAVLNSPLAALDLAPSFRPDVALLDIGLPGIDGYQLARRLRAMPATAEAVLLALTGYGQESDRDAAMAAGFNHHLVKPVALDALERLLAEVSRHRRRTMPAAVPAATGPAYAVVPGA